jgi:hypothetical protein
MIEAFEEPNEVALLYSKPWGRKNQQGYELTPIENLRNKWKRSTERQM